MIITHELKMDLARRGITPRVDVVQDNGYSRNLAILLYSGGRPWIPGAGVSVVVRFAKKDHSRGAYDVLPDGTPAGQIRGNVLTVALAPQVCTAAGWVKLAVCLVKDKTQLHSFAVELDVQDNPGLQTTSADYFKLSNTVPDTGWEPGKYLGTDENGRVVAVNAPEVDATLTKAGQAADAKAVGEKLAGVVRSVNGKSPDEGGNVVVEADSTAEAGNSGRCLFNGRVLPALPDAAKEHAHLVMAYREESATFDGPYARLYAVDEYTYDTTSDGHHAIRAGVGEYWYCFFNADGTMKTGVWDTRGTIDGTLIGAYDGSATVWSNFDILAEDGSTVWLGATEPVPVSTVIPVLCAEQILSEAQKEQARRNIGVTTEGTGGIPVIELATRIDVTGASGTVMLSEADNAALNAAIGNPFCIKVHGTMMEEDSVICDAPTVGRFGSGDEALCYFKISIIVFSFTFQRNDGAWVVEYTSAD